MIDFLFSASERRKILLYLDGFFVQNDAVIINFKHPHEYMEFFVNDGLAIFRFELILI